MNRKLISLILMIVMILSFAACGSQSKKVGLEYAEDVDVSSLPDGLKLFLGRFSLYRETGETSYDCTSVGEVNMIECVAGHSFIAEFETYGMAPGEWFFYSPDPEGVGASVQHYMGYILRKADDVEWVCENIFHVSREDMAAMLDKGTEEKLFYKFDREGTDYYCSLINGAGGSDPFRENIIRAAKYDGSRYYIVYDEFNPLGDFLDEMYAVMDVTDEGYWTLYMCTEDIPEEFGLEQR